jgi:cytochrome oxidase Cu insertion factor (SCO1/SenC/PrrC family)
MRSVILFGLVLVFISLPVEVRSQGNRKKFDDFVKDRPAVGDALPELSVYTPDGKPFQTADLRGHYTVLTFGCMT